MAGLISLLRSASAAPGPDSAAGGKPAHPRAQAPHTGDAHRSAAVEAAAGLIARTLAGCSVTGDDGAFTAAWRHQAGRELVRRGEWSARIVPGATPRLRPATYRTVTAGGPDPDTWQVLLSYATPGSGQVSEAVAWPDVVALSWATSPYAPWHGLSPVDLAPETARLLGETEQHLADEAATARGQIVAIEGAPGAIDGAAADLSSRLAKGDLVLVPRHARLQGGIAAADVSHRRVGAAPDPGLVETHSTAMASTLAACGVPPVLLLAGATTSAAALRDGMRLFALGTMAPLLRHIEAELSDKLERPVRLRLGDIGRADVAARARAYRTLTEAGMATDHAMAEAGLDMAP